MRFGRGPRRPRAIAVTGGVLGALAIGLAGAAAPAGAAVERTHAAARDALRRVEQATTGDPAGGDLTIALRDLAATRSELGPQDTAKANGLLARPSSTGGDEFLSYAGRTEELTCSTRFCIHWVTTGPDAPSLADAKNAAGVAVPGGNGVPDYVDAMLREFETVATKENTDLQWRAPVSDGSTGAVGGVGASGQFDVYIGDIGDDGVFGYAAPETASPANSVHFSAYMAMDNDYSPAEFPSYDDYLVPLQVTAAHEYNHVLQFATDVSFDTWIGEATATWMEDQVYPDGNDWINYLPRWATIPDYPITTFFTPPASGATQTEISQANKVYGSSLFVHWLADRTTLGADGIRQAWNAMETATPEDYAVDALDSRLAPLSSSVSKQFGAFAAATAEWRTAGSGFHDQPLFETYGVPDVTRSALPATGATTPLDHLAYRLYAVPQNGTGSARLTVTAPVGVASSIALVGRTGDALTGTTTVQRTDLPAGGTGTVLLTGLTGFSRVTAVVANTDTRVDVGKGWSSTTGDWTFLADRAQYAVAVGPDTPATDPGTTTTTGATTTTTAAATPTPTATGTKPPVPSTTATTGSTSTTGTTVPKATTLSATTVLAPLRTTRSTIATRLRNHGVARLRRGLTGLAFGAPGAGRLTVTVTSGGRTVATGTTRATGAGRARFTIRTTAAGRRLLKRRSRRRVTLVLRFAPAAGSAQTIRQTLTVRP
ncbi:MXAN_6640 family putative metalloprotease [Patulibacter sp. NPDC049589]|uniref:MXAN_6640 family putative metalloprotease n=1 Tax=Patulibacter sp. NPDC049589 TaxID=3154731 RepID=UPI003429B27D